MFQKTTSNTDTGKIVFGVAGGILVAMFVIGLLIAMTEMNHNDNLRKQELVEQEKLEEQKLTEQDKECKEDIEAIAIALEQYYYPKYGYYPKEVSEEVLAIIDPQVFIDPEGKHINSGSSRYSYKPSDCIGDECMEYKLTAELSIGTAHISSKDL